MRKILAGAALTLASALVLTGCATSPQDDGAADDGRLHVVASTNVYGSLVAQVGGDRVEVTSLIDSQAQDPHSYEATARDRLAVQKADLVVENGGGYDAYMTELREGSDAAVITAAEFSHDYPGADAAEHAEDEHAEHDHEDEHAEHDHDGHSHIEGFNEHVWFDVHTITHVVEQIAADLTELDPDGKADFAAAEKKVNDELTAIESDLDALHEQHEGQQVFITEPLPGLLAAAAGLDDVAPDGFASAVEEGDDVAPSTLLDALRVIDSGDVRAVLTTAQTGGSETTRVTDAAKQAGIPVATFSELLGPDQTYAQWMRSAIDDLTTALDR
ncbi:zinc ABC transporter substrate-binding protein [Microbacterium sp. ARD32]|uniref:metal ABC transporter solute-binding protein, Zn/Mn family n=1 Tax=Microbacterium sp. ARD32 TaxID=2962577 RepID=UPI002881C654|nr:zinc ABC transporter substrate-binding protein [Microbacterium sp. ARD32]MDT0157894.1 zinc ABC transporter substrate-binding protein [Microbacterium sp. ARD32]